MTFQENSQVSGGSDGSETRMAPSIRFRNIKLFKVDSVTRGIYGTSARNLTVENALPVASFLKTPGGPLSLRNAFYESRPSGHNQPNLLPYYPFYVKQSELKAVKAWNLTNGLHSLIEKMVEKCEKQNVDIKVE